MGTMASQITTHGSLLNRLFRQRSNKTPKLRITDLCAGNSPVTDEFPNKRPVTREKINLMTSSWWKMMAIFVTIRSILKQFWPIFSTYIWLYISLRWHRTLFLSQCTLGPVYTGMPLVDPVYTGIPLEKFSWNSPTLECHWRNLVESAPHWDATGETLTFAAYTGTPLEGLWQPTHSPTRIVKYAE